MVPFHFSFLSPTLFQTTVLNKYLQEQMEGLTAKVFRTYNASITLQEQLEELTVGKSRSTRSSPLHHNDVIVFFPEDETVPSKILSYNRANRAVAILCNHQVCLVPSTLWLVQSTQKFLTLAIFFWGMESEF